MQLFKKPPILYLFIILAIGSFLRLYGLNWDQGFHLHPDERAIVMFTAPLEFPKSIDELLSPESSWNPHFFAYGNFPLYLLKAAASLLANFDPLYLSYEKINLVGRAISAIADLGTLILIYLLAKKLFNQTAGLLASFFYAISVFPIQTAHFYAVDTLLTFFIILTLYQLIRFYEKPSIKNSIFCGVFFGFSLATKVSAIPLVVAVFGAVAVDFALLVLKQPHKPHIWFPHVPRFLKRLILDGVTITIATVFTFSILQPYAIIDFQEFLRQTQQQSQMTRDAFAFPYTLQYVGKTPYWYELKNIFLWGQGPILAMLSFLGLLYVTLKLLKTLYSSREEQSDESRSFSSRLARTIIILIFFWAYFFVVGKFAVGWMRYMLPLYPLLALFAAFFLQRLLSFRANPERSRRVSRGISLHALRLVGMTMTIILIVLWPLSFMHIYTKPNTRVLATNWINQNIPYGSTIAIEHWDDGLPLFGQQNYRILTLELYNPDSPYKWQIINQQLYQTDYIVIASNRLYVPLMKLTNCQKLPPGRCYAQTAEYYKRLFSGQNVIPASFPVIPSAVEGSPSPTANAIDSSTSLRFAQNDTVKSARFTKVAEFSIYPKLEIRNLKLEINDSSADESFTVYDHPKVIIFKNNEL